MPSVILQSIHPEIKHEKTKEPAAAKESTQPEEKTTSIEPTNKHFDLASIKDSIEAAMHAPFSLSTYWSHLPSVILNRSKKLKNNWKKKLSR